MAERERRRWGSGTVHYSEPRKRWIGRAYVEPRIGPKRRIQVTGTSRRDCEMRLKAAVLAAQHDARTAGDPPLGQYLTQWLEGRAEALSASSRRQYGASVQFWTRLLGRHRLGDLSPSIITDALKTCQGTRSAQAHRAILRAALNDAIREDLIERNAAELARPPRHRAAEKVIPTPEEVARIIDAEPNPVYQALWAFLALTGARPHAEATPLRWDALAEADGLLWFRGSKTESGAKPRPIDPRLVPVLESIRRPDSPFLFPSSHGLQIDESKVRKAWKAATARADAPTVKLYSLRAFAASEMARAGTDRITAARLLGHANPSVTAKFYEVSRTEDLIAEVLRRSR